MSMGLSISEKIVEKCGGSSIKFYDAGEKKGSTLMFSMAMKAVSAEVNMSSNEMIEEEKYNSQNIVSNASKEEP